LSDYDAVFDTLGGDALYKSFQIVKPGDCVASISGMPNAKFAMSQNLGSRKAVLFALVSRGITKKVKQFTVNYTYHFMKDSGLQLHIIRDYYEQGKIQPIINRVLAFSQTQDALAYMESVRAKGKVLIKNI